MQVSYVANQRNQLVLVCLKYQVIAFDMPKFYLGLDLLAFISMSLVYFTFFLIHSIPNC